MIKARRVKSTFYQFQAGAQLKELLRVPGIGELVDREIVGKYLPPVLPVKSIRDEAGIGVRYTNIIQPVVLCIITGVKGIRRGQGLVQETVVIGAVGNS